MSFINLLKVPHSVLIAVSLLVSHCRAASEPSNAAPAIHSSHQHSEGDLDVVQCRHSFYRVDPHGGNPEFVNGQESRNSPSRQYLPPGPPNPPKEESPAASFDQPSAVPVEKTFVSPSLQKSYNTLFGNKNNPDVIQPAAAQSVPANALAPVAPKSAGKVTSDDDDPKFSLERLCNDAFHSFLCKPITGPRKTPNGRLRPNAVLPPDILAGFSSSQDVTRIRPENVRVLLTKPSPSPAPFQPDPSNQNIQRVPFPTQSTIKQPTTRVPPAPFSNPTKTVKPVTPVFPSPTISNPFVIKPEPSNEVSFQAAPQTNGYYYEKPLKPFPPQVPYPSNNNQQVIPTYKPSTPKPTQGYFYDKPIIPLSSNNVPEIAQPPRVPHDCSQHKNVIPSVIANPSNESPFFVKPTPKPIFNGFTTQPKFSFSTTNTPRPIQIQTTPIPVPTHDCSTHRFSHNSFVSNPTNQNPFFIKPFNQPTPKPYVAEPPKLPSPSNNNIQIIAQPQQVNIVTTPSKQQGYFYDKPAVPFPSNNNPSVAPKPTQRPFTFQTTTSKPTSGYIYDQPRIPFPSNNINQIISQPQRTTVTTTAVPPTPCQHEHHNYPPVINSPTNQNSVVLRPDQTSNGYVYNKPNQPFPPEEVGPSNEDPVRFKPFVTTTTPSTGYVYAKPANQLLLPNSNNNVPSSINPVKNSYNYQTQNSGVFNNLLSTVSPTEPPPFDAITTAGYAYNQPKGPYASSINEKLSEPTEVKPNFVARPNAQAGYSYDKPKSIFTSQETNNQNSQFKGYSYSKPTNPYGR